MTEQNIILLRAVILGAIIFLAIGGALVASVVLNQRRRILMLKENLLEVGEKLDRIEAKVPNKEVDQRREELLNVANISFHFANREEIRRYYYDYFSEAIVQQMVSESVTESGRELKAKVPKILEGKLKGKDSSKWTSTMKLPELSVAEMFRRFQQRTIENNQVTLGLELVELDLTELELFELHLAELRTKHGLAIAEESITPIRARLRARAAENTVSRMEKAVGWVLIDGKFRITEPSSAFYKLAYDHPVNEYLDLDWEKITISVTVKKDSLESQIAGNYAQTIGKSIPIKIYGKVWQPVDRAASIWELQITPLAIY